MSDDPWVSPVHTTSADENEAYASHPLYAEVAALTAELDRLREERDLGFSMRNETMDALRKMREERDDAEARALICCEKFRPERDTLAAERERANEAARLSAEARDQADELRKGLEDLRDFASILERDRTERDDWVTRVAEEFGLSAGYDDPWGAVPALYYEIEKHMARVKTERDEARAELLRKADLAAVLDDDLPTAAGVELVACAWDLVQAADRMRDRWAEMVDPEARNRELWTPLHRAADSLREHLEMVADLAAVDAYQATPATTEREGAGDGDPA